MDTMFILNEIGKYGWLGSGAFGGPTYTQEFFNGINAWWVPAITEKSGATEIEIADEGELTIFDYDAKYVKFSYKQSGKQYTEITYHIWRPDKPYSLYRFRLICWQELFEQFYPLFEDFIYSIEFLG
jgi:hypothetical protein